MFGFSRQRASKGSYHNIGLDGSKFNIIIQNSYDHEEKKISNHVGDPKKLKPCSQRHHEHMRN